MAHWLTPYDLPVEVTGVSDMGDEKETLEANWRRLSQFKRLSTSQDFDEPDWAIIGAPVHSDQDFRRLVSELYMVWRERWGSDVTFLTSKGRSVTRVRSFGILVNTFRTAHQHSTNTAAVGDLEKWLRNACKGDLPIHSSDWETCRRELAALFNVALADLADAAALVYRSPALRADWNSRAAQSVDAILDLVIADLGLSFRERDHQYHRRQIEGRWRTRSPRPGEDQRLALTAMVEQQLIARVEDLPCEYLEVLDKLEVIGSPAAVPALQLAHAISTISRRRGSDFLECVAATWNALQPGASSVGTRTDDLR